MKINNVEIKNEMVSIEELGDMCYKKLEMARQQLEESIRDDLCISISMLSDDKRFAGFVVFPRNIYEQAEWLDSISDGYTWFTENVEAYQLELDLHTVIMMGVTELADKMTLLHSVYENSIYKHCTKEIQDDGLLCEIYEINENTGYVFMRIEETILEFSEGDMQLIATYTGINNEPLCDKQEVSHWEHRYNTKTKQYEWKEVSQMKKTY